MAQLTHIGASNVIIMPIKTTKSIISLKMALMIENFFIIMLSEDRLYTWVFYFVMFLHILIQI